MTILLKSGETGLLNTSDGVQVYYEDSGGDGPILVFTYGLGCSIFHWKHQIAAIERLRKSHFRIIWTDYRGHGFSPKLPYQNRRISLERVTSDLRELLDTLKIEKANFLGQSMGGTISMIMAGEIPDRVESLVLLSSPPKPPSHSMQLSAIGPPLWKLMIELNQRPYQRKFVDLAFKAVIGGLREPVAELIKRLGFNSYLSKQEDIDEYVEHLTTTDPNLFFDLAKDLEAMPFRRVWRQVNVPTLVIAGEKDNLVPHADLVEFCSAVPSAELFYVERGSHCPHMDFPDLVSKRIIDFLRKHTCA